MVFNYALFVSILSYQIYTQQGINTDHFTRCYPNEMICYLFFRCWTLPRHLNLPLTIMAILVQRASHSSILWGTERGFPFRETLIQRNTPISIGTSP